MHSDTKVTKSGLAAATRPFLLLGLFHHFFHFTLE
jgi:hypothetical protein